MYPLWHITRRKDFRPSDVYRPPVRGGYDTAIEPTLYATTDVNYWVSLAGGYMGRAYASGRKWAAELELLPCHPPVELEDPGYPQTVLDPRCVRVVRIIPVEAAAAERTGWLGGHWVGEYRYEGPDFPTRKKT